MIVTQHAHARFKQRQNLKNSNEMMRRYRLAIERGTLLEGDSTKPQTLSFLFDGFKYIVSEDKEVLITVIPVKEQSHQKRRHLIDKLRMKSFADEAALAMTII